MFNCVRKDSQQSAELGCLLISAALPCEEQAHSCPQRRLVLVTAISLRYRGINTVCDKAIEGLLDTYLWIAREILLQERRPLGPTSILASAYQRGLVPHHLYGKTQHKTLQARLSEDILSLRDRSVFFRSEPGKFFLRELLTDTNLPAEYRRPIPTRRRIRELRRGPALAINIDVLKRVAKINSLIEPDRILELLDQSSFLYDDPKRRNSGSVFIWSFVSVRRCYDILGYRVGRYRDDRDSFMRRQSIGFSTLVHQEDRTLFNYCDCGIVDSGVKAAKIDLDIPSVASSLEEERQRALLISFIWVEQSSGVSDLLAVVQFQCPDWFEPVRRRLALNDLRWFDTRISVNNLDDFDPWSRSVIRESKKEFFGIG